MNTHDDPTEAIRRKAIAERVPETAAAVADALGEQTWTTDELTRDFEVLAFLAPLVIVRRRSDGVKGTLQFTHMPRRYFGWRAD